MLEGERIMTAKGNGRISVLIVEDAPIYREALEGYLRIKKEQIELVGWADEQETALKLVGQHVPDVVLLDLVLRRDRRAGIEIIRQVRRTSPSTQIVVLTAYFDDDMIFDAIRAGAVTYLLKDNVSGDQLSNIVTHVRDGEPPMDPQIARRLYRFFQSPDAGVESPSALLTPREMEVLEWVAEAKSNREIAEILVISEKTVKTHVSNILKKLHLSNRTELQWWYQRQRLIGAEDGDQDQDLAQLDDET
jgi:NarL family two-component system response regulator LiaR